MLDQLTPLLASGHPALAPTRRLAHTLRRAYNTTMRAKLGDTGVWRTPDITTVDAWLLRLAEECVIDGTPLSGRRITTLLDSNQERLIWEHIIRTDSADLQRPDLAATAAMQAHAALVQYAPSFHAERFDEQADARAFRRWRQAFHARCMQEGWICAAEAMSGVIDLVRAGGVRVPKRIGWVENTEYAEGAEQGSWKGFERDLLRAFEEAGVEVVVVRPELCESQVRGVVCASVEDEVRAAAEWCRELLLQDGSLRIGVVVPDLSERRGMVERMFGDVLDPAANLEECDALSGVFDVSLGVPLVDVPVVRAGVWGIEVMQAGVRPEIINAVQRSVYFSFSDDADIRGAGWTRTSTLLSPTEWRGIFEEQLRRLGWPGGQRGLDSREYQAAERFRGVLADFGRYDRIVPRLSLADAIALLHMSTASATFQQQALDAPVQILGVIEAAGHRFDRMWIAGMTADAWPAPPRPLSFIPIWLQRAAGIPGTTPEAALAESRARTAMLRGSAPVVVVSHPALVDDQPALPSPLWSDVTFEVHEPEVRDEEGGRTPDLESFTDTHGPALHPGEAVSGGVSVLQKQAACPFRAFAEHRLGARPTDPIPHGMEARDRGTLLHAALQEFWRVVVSQDALLALDEDALALHIRDAVDAGVRQVRREPRVAEDPLLEVERERCADVLRAWMDLERARAPFTVRMREKEISLHVGDLALRGRIDRVDQLADGHLALVDYKTGKHHFRDWLDARMDEPQLPAYACHGAVDGAPLDVAALLFANVRDPRDRSSWSGLADRNDLAPGVLRSDGEGAGRTQPPGLPWTDLMQTWRRDLEQLAAAFVAGDARVDPKNPPKTCEYCPQQSFCRIHELRDLQIDTEEDA